MSLLCSALYAKCRWCRRRRRARARARGEYICQVLRVIPRAHAKTRSETRNRPCSVLGILVSKPWLVPCHVAGISATVRIYTCTQRAGDFVSRFSVLAWILVSSIRYILGTGPESRLRVVCTTGSTNLTSFPVCFSPKIEDSRLLPLPPFP